MRTALTGRRSQAVCQRAERRSPDLERLRRPVRPARRAADGHGFCLVRGRRREAPGEECMGPAAEDEQARVARVLEEELARVDSPAAAEAVVERVERLAAGQTEAE